MRPLMTSVHDAAYELLRSLGMTTFFGNPGSNELTFLDDFPSDFRYVLALQEGAGLAMADAYAQSTGAPVLVSLHAAAGVGQAMGALVNSQIAGTPLVLMSGQQARSLITLEGQLTNVDAIKLSKPLVKGSFEAPSPAAVPATLARAAQFAASAPTGPVFVSVPLDDWRGEAGGDVGGLVKRRVAARPAPEAEPIKALAERLDAARSPLLIFGAEVDAAGGWDAGVALAERLAAPALLAIEVGRISFPTDHACYEGTLGVTIGAVRKQLEGHDLVIVAGAPVFRYHAWAEGPYLPEGTELVALTADRRRRRARRWATRSSVTRRRRSPCSPHGLLRPSALGRSDGSRPWPIAQPCRCSLMRCSTCSGIECPPMPRSPRKCPRSVTGGSGFRSPSRAASLAPRPEGSGMASRLRSVWPWPIRGGRSSASAATAARITGSRASGRPLGMGWM